MIRDIPLNYKTVWKSSYIRRINLVDLIFIICFMFLIYFFINDFLSSKIEQAKKAKLNIISMNRIIKNLDKEIKFKKDIILDLEKRINFTKEIYDYN